MGEPSTTCKASINYLEDTGILSKKNTFQFLQAVHSNLINSLRIKATLDLFIVPHPLTKHPDLKGELINVGQ